MDKEGAPIMAERLLRLWDRKYIACPGWDGWLFSRGALVHKNKRWRPENLIDLRKNDEIISRLEIEINSLYTMRGLMKITKYIISSMKNF